jgi:prevent-host-death family protein
VAWFTDDEPGCYINQEADLVYYLVMSVSVNVHEAKTHLSRLLEQAMAGEDVVIMRSGRNLVRLVPVEAAPRARKIGSAAGAFTVPDDFDAPLPDEILAEFEP